MLSDLRFAFRQLVKSPGFSLVAVLIVALGIAAATTMFSTVNALVLRPVALPEPDRLVVLYENNLPRDVPSFSCSYRNYLDWRDRCRSFTSLASVGGRAMNLTGEGEPAFLQVQTVTANFLKTLGLVPAQGRDFTVEEDRPGQNQVVILSHAFWQSRLGGRADVIGHKLLLDGKPHVVVGVLPANAFFPDELEIAVPMGADVEKEPRENHDVAVFGRLAPGASHAAADAELKAVTAQIWAEHPDLERGWSAFLVPLMNDLFDAKIRTALYALLGAVGLLLLIACANLSNLLLVRATARSHEIAVRTALGAGRGRLIRQIAAESLLVTLTGGAAGILASIWATELMRALPLPRAQEISVDVRVLLAAFAATLLTGVLAGLLPALRASAARPQDALRGRTPHSGPRSRLRDGIVIAQLALSLTLLVSAALLVRSFVRLMHVNPGYVTDGALTLALRPSTVDRPGLLYDRLLAQIRELPGVTHAGVISALPLTEGNTSLNVFPRGASPLAAGESVQSSWRLIDGGYFGAMGVPLLSGRSFDGLSRDEARRSVVVSASLAKRLWGESDALGREVDIGGHGRILTVIGVVGDVRSQRLGVAPAPAFYWSMHRFIYGPMNLVVRHTGEIAPLVAAIRATVQAVDPGTPIFRVRTLADLRAASLEQERIVLGLLTGFTVTALVLATLGTYGVVAFSVQQRTTELGIRLAVGAQPRDIVRLVLGQGLRLALAGAIVGAAGAFLTTRLIATLLFETPPTDPLSYFAATAILGLATLLATFLPARRASRVDPLVALRAE